MSENSFEKITFDAWQTAAEKALRGISVDSLTKTTYDGIAVKPLYAQSQTSNQVALPSGAWQINQAINHPNIDQAKKQIAEDLEQGVNALSLYSDKSLSANGYGLKINQANLESLFENTYLDMISLRLETGLDEVSTAKTILTHSQKHGQLSLGIDPIGKLAQYGGWDGEPVAKQAVQDALKQFDATHILRADGRFAHNAGASEAQELAFILSTALCYLKWADAAHIDLHSTAQKIEICICASQNQFITIAKIRALRQLWAELLDGLGIQQSSAYIYAETSYRMVSKSDPWVNLLRATVACFSAGIGGVNQLGILPMSAAIGLSPSFDRRLARHIQTILIEESHLAEVTDPSHGSFYIENLTANITQKAWEIFQTTQKNNGLIANLLSGNIQQQISLVSKKREQDYQAEELCLVGTSEFINHDEKPYETLKVDRITVDIPNFKIKITPLTAKRDAEMFENQSEDA
ncbi:MAG: hypothetical protein COC24_001580 [Alphaproteobacteria bacterium]|nr:hypothetical protein [Alphaproteobacteria bacterium]